MNAARHAWLGSALACLLASFGCSRKDATPSEHGAAAGAGGSPAATAAARAAPPPGAVPPDPCALVAIPEIDRVLGGEFTMNPAMAAATAPRSASDDALCHYMGSDGRNLIVSTMTLQRANWDASMKVMNGRPIAGIARSAYLVPTGNIVRLWANTGKAVVIITYFGGALDAEKAEAGERAIAVKAIAAL